MKPRRCPKCKFWLNIDEYDEWCDNCEYTFTKPINIDWSSYDE